MDFCVALLLISSLCTAGPATAESLLFRVVPRQSLSSSCGYAVTEGVLRLWNRGGTCGGRAGSTVSPSPDERAAEMAQSVKCDAVSESALIDRYARGDDYGGDPGEPCEPLSLAGMASILDDFGIPAMTLKGSLEDTVIPLLESGAPVVLHYDRPSPHFALALDAEACQVFVADPADGLSAPSYGELARRMSGYVLLPLPEAWATGSGSAVSGDKNTGGAGASIDRADTAAAGVSADALADNSIGTAVAATASVASPAPDVVAETISVVRDREALLAKSGPGRLTASGRPHNQRGGDYDRLDDPRRAGSRRDALSYVGRITLRPSFCPELPFGQELLFACEYPVTSSATLFCSTSLDCASQETMGSADMAVGAIRWFPDADVASTERQKEVNLQTNSMTHGLWAAVGSAYAAAAKSNLGARIDARIAPEPTSSGVSQWSFAPYVGLLSSQVISPALLVSNTGLGLEWSPVAKICKTKLISSLSATYALTGSLAVETAIEQKFTRSLSPNPAFSWDASASAGLKLPADDHIISTGIVADFGKGHASTGGVYVRIDR